MLNWKREEWIMMAGVTCILSIPFSEENDALSFLKEVQGDAEILD